MTKIKKRTITFLKNDEILFNIESFNEEFLAGILSILSPILSDMVIKYPKDHFNIEHDGHFYKYRLITSIQSQHIKNKINEQFGDFLFYIWIRSFYTKNYSLYNFQSSDFTKGILHICDYFSVDFRNYIYSDIYDARGSYYKIKNHDFLYRYPNYFIEELNDVEESQKDNENIIRPLRKDD